MSERQRLLEEQRVKEEKVRKYTPAMMSREGEYQRERNGDRLVDLCIHTHIMAYVSDHGPKSPDERF